ncbi:MAG: single-stranded DNA-binding protein [Pelatocladus maniniholoensis HA4357-MV3]|jgi:single-strand DNA-binding protein|uniref:Single-stranded DNA-binding protein n=1 Tax=Pelatocladus maniniholoensis HA4357-MV3 TaxID=1117104 RepID=A0A9E3H9C6_9NOST|nr:single-stranded DNA-binding protein [Pelatocladus maniniholoensis HA4357-MV3]
MTQQAYVNQVQLVGRVGQNPEIRYFESGTVKTALTIAIKPPYKSDAPLWFDLEAWGNIAEIAAQYVKKGSTIGISGELVFDKWTDKNTGELRNKPLIRLNNLELIGSPRSNSGEEQTETNDGQNQIVNANF